MRNESLRRDNELRKGKNVGRLDIEESITITRLIMSKFFTNRKMYFRFLLLHVEDFKTGTKPDDLTRGLLAANNF